MNKLLKINLKDIIYDHKNASDILNKACSRPPLTQISGGFRFGDNLIFCLNEIENTVAVSENYIIAPMNGLSEADVIGEINARYTSGFSTIFCFELDNKIWGVFSQKKLNL